MAQSVLLHWESVPELPSTRPWHNTSHQDRLPPIVLCLFKANTAHNMHVLKRVCSLHRNVLAHGFGPESTQMSLLSFLPEELSHTWQMLSICSWTSLPALPSGAMVIPAHKYRAQSSWSGKGPIKITLFSSLLLTEPPTTWAERTHLLSEEPLPNVQPEFSWCSFNPFSCTHDLDFSIEPCSRFAQSLRERIVFYHWILHHQREQKMNKQRAENESLFGTDWSYRKLFGKQHFPL